MKRMNKTKVGLAFAVLVVIIVIVLALTLPKPTKETIKIGFSTDLSSFAAYWGEPSLAGAETIIKEFKEKGYNIELIVEDSQLDPDIGITGIKKLIEFDDVDALYIDFTPVVLASAPYLNEKEVFYVYGSPVISPLDGSLLSYKVYSDYQELCYEAGKELNNFEKVGYFKLNNELGELCLKGLKETYTGELLIEEFGVSELDFRTMITKFKSKNVTAIFAGGFSHNNLEIVQSMIYQGFPVPVVGICGDITESVAIMHEDSSLVSCYGFIEPDIGFINKIKESSNKNFQTYIPSALTYIHIKQVINALILCEKDKECIKEKMNESEKDSLLSFEGFENRIAKYKFNKIVY